MLCAGAILHNWHQIAPIAYYSKNRIINDNIAQNAKLKIVIEFLLLLNVFFCNMYLSI